MESTHISSRFLSSYWRSCNYNLIFSNWFLIMHDWLTYCARRQYWHEDISYIPRISCYYANFSHNNLMLNFTFPFQFTINWFVDVMLDISLSFIQIFYAYYNRKRSCQHFYTENMRKWMRMERVDSAVSFTFSQRYLT